MDPSPTPIVNFDFRTIDWRVVFAFLAIIVAVVLAFYFQWWRNRKRLSYEILSDVELVSSEKIRGKVEIRYEGQPVQSVHLVVVKLINDGYQPIKKDEFEKPVRFTFKRRLGHRRPPGMRLPELKVLTAEKEEFRPQNIATEITYGDNWVEVSPALLNRKDYVQFKVLLNSFSRMEVDARIVGISAIQEGGNLIVHARWALGLIAVLLPPLLILPIYAGTKIWAGVIIFLVVVTVGVGSGLLLAQIQFFRRK